MAEQVLGWTTYVGSEPPRLYATPEAAIADDITMLLVAEKVDREIAKSISEALVKNIDTLRKVLAANENPTFKKRKRRKDAGTPRKPKPTVTPKPNERRPVPTSA